MKPEPAPNPAEEKLDFKAVLPVFLIVIIDLMGFSLFIPLLSLYAATFGASEFLIGILAATYPLMQFVGAPIWVSYPTASGANLS